MEVIRDMEAIWERFWFLHVDSKIRISFRFAYIYDWSVYFVSGPWSTTVLLPSSL